MPASTTYTRRKARDQCPGCGRFRIVGPVYCTACRGTMQTSYAQQRDAALEAPGVNQVACCGKWHAVVALPCRMACCGRVFGLIQPQEG